MMTLVGLTGGMGTGKSEVAGVWAEQGAVVLEADAYGHRVLKENAAVRKRLVERFGERVLNRRGQLDRGEVASLAFASPAATRFLNRTVGGPLVKLLHADVRRLRRGRSGVLVVDAALICEWRSALPFDIRVLVTAPRHMKLKWLSARGISYRQARERMRAQWSDSRKRAWADIEIRNRGTLTDLRRKAMAVWRVDLVCH